MGNELDETTGPVNAEGRDVNVIEKQLKAEVGAGTKFLELAIWILGFPLAFLIGFIASFNVQVALLSMLAGVIPGLIFQLMKMNALAYLRKLQQRIQANASQIDNYLEQRVVILQNLAALLSKSIDLDKDVMKTVAAYRGGVNPTSDQVRNETSGITSNGKANNSGQYSVNISLRDGINVLSVTATDAVGNSSRTSVEITTNASVGRVTLVVNPGTIFLNKSPKSFRITATATDSTGAPVVGANVCMMITAPGLSPISLPCSLSDSNGRAIGVYTFPENYATEGRGLILATYTLTQGDPLEATTPFTVKKKP